MAKSPADRLKVYAVTLEIKARVATEGLISITPITDPDTWTDEIKAMREPAVREMIAYRSALSGLYSAVPELRQHNSALDMKLPGYSKNKV